MTSTGTRFADLLPDESDFTDYLPRHVRAVPLSPELQEALDRAFAPERVEPEGTPELRRLAEPDETAAVEIHAWVEPDETPELRRLAEPVEAAAVEIHAWVDPEEASELRRLAEPVEAAAVEIHAWVDPEEASELRRLAEPVSPEEPGMDEPEPRRAEPPAPAALTLVPPVPSSPSSPSFPDPGRYAKRGASVDPALSAGIMGRFFRQKVDPARLVVRTV